MKRFLIIFIALTLLLLISIGSVLYWAVATTSGTRWLVNFAIKTSGAEAVIEQIEGTLADELLVRGLSLRWDADQVLCGRLSLEINSFGFFPPTLDVEKLEIERLVLHFPEGQQSSSNKETTSDDEVIIGLNVLPGWLTAEIRNLRVQDFVYLETGSPEDEVVIADLIAGHYRLFEGRLIATGFSYHSPYVELDGDFNWDLSRPHLVMNADVHLPETCVKSELFEKLRLPTRFPGRLEFDGDWNGYSGPVMFGGDHNDGEQVRLSANASGSWREIRFESLQGQYLGGQVAGDLDLAWVDDFKLHGTISGEQLDPSMLVEDLNGRSTFDVDGELFVPYDEQSFEARLDVVLHDGVVRGHSLQGRANTRWFGTSLEELDVDLTGEGSHLIAKGKPHERIDLDLDIPDLSPYHPDLQGTVMAEGWIRWGDSTIPTGDLIGVGEGLVWQESAIEEIRFRGQSLSEGAPFLIEAEGKDWHHGEWSLSTAEVRLSGDLSDHSAQLMAIGDLGHFEVKLEGQYQEEMWQGRLEQLDGANTPLGNWSMADSTQLSWKKGALTIDNLNLEEEAGAKISFSADRWGNQQESHIDLSWTHLNLMWLAKELAVLRLDGKTDGELHYETVNAKPFNLSGQISATGQVEDETFELVYEEFSAEIDWDQDGLRLESVLKSQRGEFFDLNARSSGPPAWAWPPENLIADIVWKKLDLMRFNRFLDHGSLDGDSGGTVHFEMKDRKFDRADIEAKAQGRIEHEGNELGPLEVLFELHWDEGQFLSEAKVENKNGGSFDLYLTSLEDPEFSWPGSGKIDFNIDALNLQTFNPWLPEGLDVAGQFQGEGTGYWKDAYEIDLNGRLQLLESRLEWDSEEGHILLPVDKAELDWQWLGSSLSGTMVLGLKDYGAIQGEWQLPIPAKLPVKPDKNGPMRISVDGKMRAIGLLSAVGPWVVQDVEGETISHLLVDGTWNKPNLQGTLEFKEGKAYLPKAGVQLEGINLQVKMSGQKLLVEELKLRSGPGELKGRGVLDLNQWQLSNYKLELSGKDLEVLNLPEAHLLCDPDLVFTGSGQKFSLRGSVGVPKLTIQGLRAVPEALKSTDVEIITQEVEKPDTGIESDVRVTVALGENVSFNSGGVETKLGGGGVVTTNPKEELIAFGEIELLSGSYTAYGTNLEIKQGVLIYNGDPITNPHLRIFAAREIGNVLAGVQITGTAEAPIIQLHSRPAMPERDILGYIMMGRPIRQDRQEADVLAMGAGTLLPRYGEGLAGLGVTEIDIQGLFVGGGGIRLRYQLAESWELESVLGIESGADIFYIIEFE